MQGMMTGTKAINREKGEKENIVLKSGDALEAREHVRG